MTNQHGTPCLTEDAECGYCGSEREEGETFYVHQPYSFEPALIICPTCKEERPWK